MSDWDKFEEQDAPPESVGAPPKTEEDATPLAPTTPEDDEKHASVLAGKLNKLADDLWTAEQQLERLKATRKDLAAQLAQMVPPHMKMPVHTGDYQVEITNRTRTYWDQERLREVMTETGYDATSLPPFVNSKMQVNTEVLDRQKPDVRDAFLECRDIKNAGTAVEVTPATSIGGLL